MKKFTKIALVTATIASSFAIANSLTPEPKLTTEVLTGDFDKTADSTVFSVATDNSQVIDNARKLVWSRCLVGQTYNASTASCDGVATEFASWQDALNAQKDGWRVPNIKELATIVEETQAIPAVNTSLFPFANTLSFYGHGDTTETTDTSKYITTSDSYPDEKCIQDNSGWYPRWIGEKSGWTCTNPKIPAKYSVQTSSAYIWSSTPIAHSTDDAQADKAYALNLADGSLQTANRSGEAIGGYSDNANEKRARYVILVKDAS